MEREDQKPHRPRSPLLAECKRERVNAQVLPFRGRAFLRGASHRERGQGRKLQGKETHSTAEMWACMRELGSTHLENPSPRKRRESEQAQLDVGGGKILGLKSSLPIFGWLIHIVRNWKMQMFLRSQFGCIISYSDVRDLEPPIFINMQPD